jgi:shikimate kinase/3-dehydroquinate synthase
MHRPLVLNGFMATGKSTLGRRLAELTGHPFVDVDERVEARAGLSVSRIFAERGEPEFRRLEREELETVLAEPGAKVIAVGGGALSRREMRLGALDRAVVVTLLASPVEILRRAREGGRPLLAGSNPLERANELLEQRARGYAEAHGVVDTEGRAIDEIAHEIREIWARDGIAVAAAEQSYTVEIGSGIATARLPSLARGSSATLLVTDEVVGPLHGARVQGALVAAGAPSYGLELASGEQHKTVASVERIWRAALEHGLDRKSLLVGLGGGVVTDITGFAAATWMRGVRWIGLPTTLLAMVDASVGGKTAVDLGSAKNVVGAFWQPAGVLCDVDFLRTEGPRAYTSALAEVVKTALIGDPELFELLEREAPRVKTREPEIVSEMVRRSVRVKARIVSLDERESGLRAVLNLGHTIGHALEGEAGFTRYTHGEAVSLGLVAALGVGARLGKTPDALAARTIRLLRALDLPCDLAGAPLAAAAERIDHDKKRAGRSLKFVVACDVGEVETVNLEILALREHIRALQ